LPNRSLCDSRGRDCLPVRELWAAHSAAAPETESWRGTFGDEFDGGAGSPPNTSTWLPDVGGTGWGNRELQYYTLGDNTYLDGQGHLVIEARGGSDGHCCWYGTCRYTSGKLTTHAPFSQVYGRFEARLKLPLGAGMFPAFWLLGANIDDVGYPDAGVIDVMESLGQRVGEVQQLTKDQAGDRWVFDHPFYVILNLAVGGDWPGDPDSATVFPGRLLVDYVRVYQPA
jgi:beta-glucanase (GH16 family)